MAQDFLFHALQRSKPSRWPASALERCAEGWRSSWTMTRLPGAWLHDRRVRAELLALDDDQLRDAGITNEALAARLRRPFRFEPGS